MRYMMTSGETVVKTLSGWKFSAVDWLRSVFFFLFSPHPLKMYEGECTIAIYNWDCLDKYNNVSYTHYTQSSFVEMGGKNILAWEWEGQTL